jgi:hypothetical protein
LNTIHGAKQLMAICGTYGREEDKRLWWANVSKRNHMKISGVFRRTVSEWVLKKQDKRTGFIWLGTGMHGELLQTP